MCPDQPSTPASALTFDYDVVIPTHGRNPSFLHEAIRSIERQTVPARTIIVVVDGNRNAAEALQLSHPHVRVVLLDKPVGAAAARQAGIEACTSEWVSFLDDDDLWAADKQERTAAYLASHPSCRAVRAGYWMFTDHGSPHQGLNGQLVEIRGDSVEELEKLAEHAQRLNNFSYLEIEGDSLGLLLEFNRGVIGTSVVRRDVLTSIPSVPSGQRPGDDHLLFIHVASVTEWHLVRERLAFYRLHGAQDTRRGGIRGALGIVSAKSRAWEHHGRTSPRPLVSYGPIYRAELRQLWWPSAKQGRLGDAARIAAAGFPLLPRWRDRLLALVPEPVVWRVRHRILRRGTTAQPRPEW